MGAIPCNDPLARCEDGNLFRVNLESVSGTVEGRVNGQSTGPLPHGQKMILPNDLPGTAGSLDLVVNGQTFPVCSGLETYTQARPQDVGMLFSEIPANTSGGVAASPEDVLLVQVPPALEGMSPGEGAYDLASATDDTLMWIALSILAGLEQIDEASGVAWLHGATDGFLDLRMTGTDGPPFVADMVNVLASRDARGAMRVIAKGAGDVIQVMRNAAGHLVVALRVKGGIARQISVGIVAAMTRNRVAHVVAGTRGALGSSAAAQAGSRLPVVGFLIVGVVDVVEWYANPASRGDWSLLMSTLFIDFGAVAIATLAGAAVVGGIVAALGGAAALTLGAAVLVAAVGVGVGLAVGVGLSWLAQTVGAIPFVDRVLTKVGDALGAVAQGAVTVVERFANGMARAIEAIDDATMDPVEWAQEVDRGLNQMIQQRIDGFIDGLMRRR